MQVRSISADFSSSGSYKRNCAGAKHNTVEKMASGSCCWGNLVALKMLEDGSFEQGDAVQLMKSEVTIGRLQGRNFMRAGR